MAAPLHAWGVRKHMHTAPATSPNAGGVPKRKHTAPASTSPLPACMQAHSEQPVELCQHPSHQAFRHHGTVNSPCPQITEEQTYMHTEQPSASPAHARILASLHECVLGGGWQHAHTQALCQSSTRSLTHTHTQRDLLSFASIPAPQKSFLLHLPQEHTHPVFCLTTCMHTHMHTHTCTQSNLLSFANIQVSVRGGAVVHTQLDLLGTWEHSGLITDIQVCAHACACVGRMCVRSGTGEPGARPSRYVHSNETPERECVCVCWVRATAHGSTVARSQASRCVLAHIACCCLLSA